MHGKIKALTNRKIHDASDMEPKTPDKASWAVKCGPLASMVMLCMRGTGSGRTAWKGEAVEDGSFLSRCRLRFLVVVVVVVFFFLSLLPGQRSGWVQGKAGERYDARQVPRRP